MSLEDRVGQVFMLGFHGRNPGDALFAIRGLRAGGVIYFGRNTGTAAETAALSSALQRLASSCAGLPLMISADQEGGVVTRLSAGLPGMPGAMGLGAAGDPSLTQEVSFAIGTQLRAAGVNVNLAPVLDVNDNPLNPVIGVRSFGGDPEAVSRHGRAAVKGYLESGVMPTGKHFPGHGNTAVDSHLALPVLDHPMQRLEQVELAPFSTAIAAGIPAIMPAHIVFKAIDPLRPATMSPEVLQGLLRGRMGFRGLIVTDCMEMDAVSKDPGTPRAAALALKAGADMLLISHTPELQAAAVQAVLDAVRSGEIQESRLDEAVARVLGAKEALGLPNPLPATEADTPGFRALSRRAHAASITLVRDSGQGFPVRQSVTTSQVAVFGPFAGGGNQPSPAGSCLVRALSTIPGIAARQMQSPAQEDCGASVTVALTENAWKDPEQAAAVRRLLRDRPEAIVVATRDPYDLRALPETRTFICTYSPRPEAMAALARVLAGQDVATGTLPVALE